MLYYTTRLSALACRALAYAVEARVFSAAPRALTIGCSGLAEVTRRWRAARGLRPIGVYNRATSGYDPVPPDRSNLLEYDSCNV